MSTADLPQLGNCITLDWFDETEVVEVNPRDKQRFDIQKDRAIQILQAAKEADRFQGQFGLLLNQLALWAHHNRSKVARAILTLQDGALAFVVVQQSGRYDEALQDALLELDFAAANDADLDLVKLKTVLLPSVSGDALWSFLDKRLLIMVYQDGKRERPRQIS
jgi:hypothetical protein